MNPAFCVRCGEPVHSATGHHPFVCVNGHESWVNPKPIAVCVQPIRDETKLIGLAVARRAIEPKLGMWGLIGGNMEDGETVEQAASREWQEETGIEHGRLIGLGHSFANGKGHVLIEVYFEAIPVEEWDTAKLCPENDAFGVWRNPFDEKLLGFPIHNWIAGDWWNRHRT